MSVADFKRPVLRLLLLTVLVSAVLAAPAVAQQPACAAECSAQYALCLEFCAVNNPTGTSGVLCGWSCYGADIVCLAGCWNG